MTSEQVMDAGFKVGWWPYFIAEKLPRGPLRFLGFIVAVPLGLVLGIPFSIPFLLVGVVLDIWEHANR